MKSLRTFLFNMSMLCVLFFIPTQVGAMQIYVHQASGPTLTLDTEPSDSTENVKQKIQDLTGIDPVNQRIVYTNTRLQEGRTLSDYNISGSATVRLVILTQGRASMIIPVSTSAGTTTCTWLAQYTDCSFQDALSVAQGPYFDDVTLNVSAGLYATSSAASYVSQFDTQSLTLVGLSGATQTSIQNTNVATTTALSIQARGPVTVQGLRFASSTGTGLVIEDHASTTLGVFTVRVQDSVFENNASSGLRVYDRYADGSVSIVSSRFANNVRDQGDGGGLFVDTVAQKIFPMTLENNTFASNTAANGGGAWLDANGPASPIVLTGNVFTSNHGTSYGGGLFLYANDRLDMRNNVLTLNTSAYSGASAYLFIDVGAGNTASSLVANNTFTENIGGSALRVAHDAAGVLAFQNNTIARNVSTAETMLLQFTFASNGPMLFANNLIYKNQSAPSLSVIGIEDYAANTITVAHNTLADNTASSTTSGAFLIKTYDGDTWNVHNNIFWNNVSDLGLTTTPTSQLTFTSNNINYSTTSLRVSALRTMYLDPLFANASANEYNLQSRSPLIDIGASVDVTLPLTDLLGLSRTFGAGPDLGVYELFVEPAVTTSQITFGGSSAPEYGCADSKALNYKKFIVSAQELCVYANATTSLPMLVFTKNLQLGMKDTEVKALQVFLNAKKFTISSQGAGSLGKETTVFGPATRAAVVRYQKARGIQPASGFFGPLTRKAVNGEFMLGK